LRHRTRAASTPVTTREKIKRDSVFEDAQLTGIRVLVVDDNELNLTLLGRLLKGCGAEGIIMAAIALN
jgi:hypothetical protein